MIRFTFPALIQDACEMGVAPVLRQVLAVTLSENMTSGEAVRYLDSLLKGAPNRQNVATSVVKGELNLDRLAYTNLLYLLFQQQYTGLERDPEVEGAIGFLSQHYDITPEQKDQLWMTQHLYLQALENEKAGLKPPTDPSFRTWVDERALDVMKQAIEPFGEDVESYFAPFYTSLEVQTDMRRADLGDANAMLEVAFDLIEGRGVLVDFMQAERWAREALHKGTTRSEEAKKIVDFLELFNDRH